jgi:hypothetical protein
MPAMPRHAARLTLALALLLPGCKTAQTLGEKPWGFTCPAAGTAVVYDDGRSLAFAGADPADPGLCLARGAGGQQVRLAWGMVEETAAEGRGHRPGMAPLFPAKSGSNVGYTADVSSPGSGIQYRYDTRWRLVGWQKVVVPAGSFNAVVFERAVQGTGANAAQGFTLTYWVDGGSGVVVKRAVEVRPGGSTLLRPFQAVKLSLPPPPREEPQAAGSGPPRS